MGRREKRMYFCLKTEQIPRISYMNKTEMQKGWMHFLRTAEEYILYFVRRGTMYLREGEIQYEIGEGEYILLQPGMTHVGYRESECEYYYIHFGADTLQELTCVKEKKIKAVLEENRKLFYMCDPLGYEFYEKSKLIIPKTMRIENLGIRQKIQRMIEEAIDAFTYRKEHFKWIGSCKLMEVLAEVASYYADMMLCERESDRTLAQHQEKVQRILHFLHGAYGQKITGERIASLCSMSFDYLNRLFKKQTGITIFEYLNRIRIHKAKELLLTGTMKSSEIAAAVGYCDEYHFSKAFKKEVGVSPRKYLEGNHVWEEAQIRLE